MHWLTIDVSSLIGKPGATRKLTESGQVQGWQTGLGRVDESNPVHVDLTLASAVGGIGVSGAVQGRFELCCSRCLIEYGQDFGLELNEQFYSDPQAAESNDGYKMDEQTVDLEPMLRDAIVLNIPIKPVHSVDCKGLCPVCGADMNTSNCRHGEQPVDIRWAALKGLVVEE